MSKGGGSQTQTTSVDPQIKAEYLAGIEAAKQTGLGLKPREFAGFTPTYETAETQFTNLGMTPFTSANIQEFMDPYQQEVIDAALGDIERQRQIQQVGNAGQATMARSFGGSRQGVVEAGTNEAALRAAGTTAAGLRSQGYNTAATLAQNARNLNLAGLQGVMGVAGQRQALTQQELDAIRNLPIEQLQLVQAARGQQMPNLGMTTTTPTTSNPLAGALGGALAGSMLKIGGATGNPYAAGAGALLGLLSR